MIRKKRGTVKPHASSIILQLAPLFEARNVRTPFSFLLKNGISNTSAQKMMNGKAVQINFRQLTTLCLALNCTPNDLFALRDLEVPENHALRALQATTDSPLPTIEEWIKGKSVQEIRELLRK